MTTTGVSSRDDDDDVERAPLLSKKYIKRRGNFGTSFSKRRRRLFSCSDFNNGRRFGDDETRREQR